MADTLREEIRTAINEAKHPLSCSIWKPGSLTCSCGNEADAVIALLGRVRAEAVQAVHDDLMVTFGYPKLSPLMQRIRDFRDMQGAAFGRYVTDDEIAGRQAAAWGEGHKAKRRRDPNDGCMCGAWSSSECGCGKYGTGRLLSLDDNPYWTEGTVSFGPWRVVVECDGATYEDALKNVRERLSDWLTRHDASSARAARTARRSTSWPSSICELLRCTRPSLRAVYQPMHGQGTPMPESVERMMVKALRLRAANGGRHLHHRSCIHNLTPDEQIELRRGRWSREQYLTIMDGRMPEQITPEQWEIESPFEAADDGRES